MFRLSSTFSNFGTRNSSSRSISSNNIKRDLLEWDIAREQTRVGIEQASKRGLFDSTSNSTGDPRIQAIDEKLDSLREDLVKQVPKEKHQKLNDVIESSKIRLLDVFR